MREEERRDRRRAAIFPSAWPEGVDITADRSDPGHVERGGGQSSKVGEAKYHFLRLQLGLLAFESLKKSEKKNKVVCKESDGTVTFVHT